MNSEVIYDAGGNCQMKGYLGLIGVNCVILDSFAYDPS